MACQRRQKIIVCQMESPWCRMLLLVHNSCRSWCPMELWGCRAMVLARGGVSHDRCSILARWWWTPQPAAVAFSFRAEYTIEALYSSVLVAGYGYIVIKTNVYKLIGVALLCADDELQELAKTCTNKRPVSVNYNVITAAVIAAYPVALLVLA